MDEFGKVIHLTGTVVDTGGKGVSAVAVANGELIECTDNSGRYDIEVRAGIHRFLTITIPHGYSTSSDGHYRRLQFADGGGHTFTLQPQESPSTKFAVAHITDLHVQVPEDAKGGKLRDGFVLPETLHDGLQAVEADLDPDFVIATGDLTEDGTTAQLKAYRSVADASDLRIYEGFGTHDASELIVRQPGQPVEPGGEIPDWFTHSTLGNTLTGYFETIVGPTHYSLDYGDWHFALYPNEHYSFSEYDRIRKARWLTADLARQPQGRPIVIGTHMPPDREWLDQLAEYDVRLVLHGHTHSSKVFRYRDILVASTPALGWGSHETNPRGYRALRFDGDRLEVELRSVGGRKVTTPAPAILNNGADSSGLKLAWETELPAHVHRAAPVVFDDDLIISMQDEDDAANSGVCRVRHSDGSIVWTTTMDSAVRNSVAVSDGGIFSLSFCGRLSRLDAATGDTVWQVDTHGFPERWTATSPVIADGVVYIGAKSGYGAHDIATGEELWFRRFTGTLDLMADHVGDKWAAYYKPMVFEDLLITLVSRRGLVAMRRSDGHIVWERSLPNCQDYWASPVLVGNWVISGGESDYMLAVRARDGVDVWNQRVLEETDFDYNYVTGITVNDGRIYGGSCGGSVIACQLDTGEVLWRFQSGPNVLDMAVQHRGISTVLAPPVLHGERLAVCGLDAMLYLLNTETGECEAETGFEAPITAAPVVLEHGGLCLATWDGRLRCFR
jgi:outer membrane protein assembly factor BamB/predicted MPP superfamily phosphohydrolase